jgi:hypothetical protein
MTCLSVSTSSSVSFDEYESNLASNSASMHPTRVHQKLNGLSEPCEELFVYMFLMGAFGGHKK